MEISYQEFYDAKGALHVNITCHVGAMQPMSGDMARWGGVCEGQLGFTCHLTDPRTAELGGDNSVTCTVTNAANNDHSAEASVSIRLGEKGWFVSLLNV